MYILIGGEHSYEIFKYVRMSLSPDIKHTRYDVPKAALMLLTKHSCQFNQYLVDDYEVGTFTFKYLFFYKFCLKFICFYLSSSYYI